MPLERLLGYLEAVAGLLRSQPRCLSCRVPNHRSSQMAAPVVCGSRWRHLLQPLLSVLPLQMLSWLVIFFASGSPQAIGQRVTLSALRVTAWVRVGPNLLGQGIVLSANKTARPSLRVLVPSSSVVGALNAFGLFARAVWHGGSQHNRPFRRAPRDITSQYRAIGRLR